VHNGEIDGIDAFRKVLMNSVADELFPHMLGTTDSEVMFYLALTLGLETDPAGVLSRMAGLVEKIARAKGIADALWMTLGMSDGESVYAVRYASDGNAPTLYYSRDVDDIYRCNPELRGRSSPSTRLIVSEPTGTARNVWLEVPQSSFVRIHGGESEITDFKPAPPA
jgi:glutamine amidotransferase